MTPRTLQPRTLQPHPLQPHPLQPQSVQPRTPAPLYQARRLLPAMLSGAGLLLLSACVSAPDYASRPAPRQGPSACFDASCCTAPASLQFEPFRLYCRARAEDAESRTADASATLTQAIAAARAERGRQIDADAVLCVALHGAAGRPGLGAQDSLALLDDRLLACQASYGEHSEAAGQAMVDAAGQRLDMGQVGQVQVQLERAIDIAKRTGSGGLEGQALDALGRYAGQTGDSAGERKMLLQAVELKKAAYGEASTPVAVSYRHLALSHSRTGEGALAREWYLRAIGILIDKQGASHPETMEVMAEFASSHADDGNLKQAQIMFDMLLPKAILAYGARDERTVDIVNNLGSTLERQKRYAKALTLFDRALKIRRSTMPNSVRHGVTALNAAKAKRALSSCSGARVYVRETQRVAKAVQSEQTTDPKALAFLADVAAFNASCRGRPAAPKPLIAPAAAPGTAAPATAAR